MTPADALPPGLAIPASARLVAAADDLARAVERAAEVEVLRTCAHAVGLAWVEALLDGFVLPLAAAARGPGAGQRTSAMIRDLAGTLVGHGVRRTDLARGRTVVTFLDTHVVTAPVPEVRFAIDDRLGAAIAAASGPAAPAPAVAAALHTTVDTTLAHCLDGPLAVLGLGVVTRTAARVGRAAIASRVRGEVDRAVLVPEARARLQATLAGFVRSGGPAISPAHAAPAAGAGEP